MTGQALQLQNRKHVIDWKNLTFINKTMIIKKTLVYSQQNYFFSLVLQNNIGENRLPKKGLFAICLQEHFILLKFYVLGLFIRTFSMIHF